MLAKISSGMGRQVLQEESRAVKADGEGSLIAIFLNFARESTSHGFPRIFTSKSYFWKIHWTVIFLVFTGICCWQVLTSVQTYFDYEVDVKVTIEYARELDFPSVTVCNMNALRVSKLKSTRFEDLYNMKAYFSDNNCQAAPNMPCTQQSQGASNQAGSSGTLQQGMGQQGGSQQGLSTQPAIQIQQNQGSSNQTGSSGTQPAILQGTDQLGLSTQSAMQTQQNQGSSNQGAPSNTQPAASQSTGQQGQSQQGQSQQGQSTLSATQTQQNQGSQSQIGSSNTQPALPQGTGQQGQSQQGQSQQGQSTQSATQTQQNQGSPSLTVSTSAQPASSQGTSQQGQSQQSTQSAMQTQQGTMVISVGQTQLVQSVLSTQQTQSVTSAVPSQQTQQTQSETSTVQTQQTLPVLSMTSSIQSATQTEQISAIPEQTIATVAQAAIGGNIGIQNIGQGGSSPPARPGDSIRRQLTGSNDYWGLMKASEVTDLSDISSFFTPTKKEIRSHGHLAEDLIRQCSFNQASCSSSDFIMTENRRYGKCYTFNHGQGETIRTSSKYGSQSGLKLTLYPEEKEYAGLFYQEVGIKVLVHAAHTTPYPEDMGIVVTPGMGTNVAIRMKQVDKLGGLYGDCRLDDGTEKYSLLNCTKECLYRAIKKQCGCEENLVEEDWNKTCSFMNATQYVCVQTLTDLYTNNSLDCSECFEPCSETRYLTQVSTSKWPAPPFLAILNSKEAQNSTNASVWIVNATDPSKDYARVFIYFGDLEYDKVVQKPSYTIDKLMSDIGGTLGLYVGISFCTLYELVEVFINMIAALWKRHAMPAEAKVEPIVHYS